MTWPCLYLAIQGGLPPAPPARWGLDTVWYVLIALVMVGLALIYLLSRKKEFVQLTDKETAQALKGLLEVRTTERNDALAREDALKKQIAEHEKTCKATIEDKDDLIEGLRAELSATMSINWSQCLEMMKAGFQREIEGLNAELRQTRRELALKRERPHER